MGLNTSGVSVGSDPCPPAGNPVPTNFTISGYHEVGTHLVLMVTYPDAKNYEGNKVLVLRDTQLADVAGVPALDPHFERGSALVARFEPTPLGWDLAVNCAKSLREGDS